MSIRPSRRGMLALVVACMAMGAMIASAQAAGRVALLIGNQDYSAVTPLKNPANDVALLKSSLEAAGFDRVEVVMDQGRSDLVKTLRAFEDAATDADVALVYYSGHGMEMNGQNYLVPVDARLQSDKDVEDEAVSLDRVQRSIEGAKKLKLIILDACRNNPFSEKMTRSVGKRSLGKGLARVEPDSADMLIAFASKAGTEAQDGQGGNSPFASALAKYLVQPGVDIRIALGQVRDDVVQATNHDQEPFVYGSLGGAQIFLNIKEVNINVTTTGNPASPTGQSEAAADWQNIRDLADKELLDAFIAKHGTDPVYRMLAEKKLKLLAEAEQTKGADASDIAWASLKGSTDASALTRFVERYPDSQHKQEAQQQIAALTPQKGLAINVQQQESQAIKDCHLLAGEPQSLPGFNGVLFRRIDSARAQTACAQAVNESPDDGMLVNLLGRTYDAGRDYTQARHYYEKAVDLGNMYALTNLGWFSVYGSDGPIDILKAKGMFEKAADAGNAYGQASLGWLYRTGYDVLPQDYTQALHWYRQAADKGNANAQATMGWFYREGNGVAQDYVMSLDFYRNGAESGDTDAISSVGYAYQNGLGVAQDYAEAKIWYEKGANAGDEYSMSSLAWLYDSGNGVPQDYVEARYWYEKSANAGSAYAMGSLSRLYGWGLGTKADPKEAVRWAVAAVESGDPTQLTDLKTSPDNFTEDFRKELQSVLKDRGLYSGDVDGIFSAATSEALDKLAAGYAAANPDSVASADTQSVSSASASLAVGNVGAKLSSTTTDTATPSTTSAFGASKTGSSALVAGVMGAAVDDSALCSELAGEPLSKPGFSGVLTNRIDSDRAIRACGKAVASHPGDAALLNMLGRAYNASNNYDDAIRYYQQAADAGDLFALTNLAWFSIYGTNVPQDMEKGMGMLQKGSDAGNPYAQASLGQIYREGYGGIEKDTSLSVSLYQKSADQGYPNAMSIMGWFYREGEGVSKDPTKALEWYRKAASAGDVDGMSSAGYALQNGAGTAVDLIGARHYYEMAADLNDPYATASLGWLYESGNGVVQDYGKARELYEKAAAGGNGYAMANLVNVYDQGLGVDADPEQAANWAVQSIDAGETSKLDAIKAAPENFSEDFRKQLQKLLKKRGVYKGPADGRFGRATLEAIDKLASRHS